MRTKLNPGEARKPTSKWSGAGLSLSNPDYVLRKMKQNAEEQMVSL